jgi:hypothetical protein
MYKMFKQGVASLGYRDAPNLFDQIIVSKNAISDSLSKIIQFLKQKFTLRNILSLQTDNTKAILSVLGLATCLPEDIVTTSRFYCTTKRIR